MLQPRQGRGVQSQKMSHLKSCLERTEGKIEEKDLNGTLRPRKERKDREATQKLAGSVGDGDIFHQSTLEN